MTSHVFEHVDQLELFKARADGLDKAFFIFHQENPRVYQLLVRFARQAKAAGRTRFGIKMLLERIRWYEAVETNDPTGLKVNNSFTSRYARLLMQQERCSEECTGCNKPECLRALFEVRELTTPSDLEEVA